MVVGLNLKALVDGDLEEAGGVQLLYSMDHQSCVGSIQ